jgi:sporulation protein YlmC with PRC-barrel domain
MRNDTGADMGEIAGWVAPIATAIAAIMTASNLGTRVTGWGFVVFSIGSLSWVTFALATDQQNLLLANAFLTIVNFVGIWRWLGRQADSNRASTPDLFALGTLSNCAVVDHTGETVGHVVNGMAECSTGRISYLVVREGSEAAITERLRALPWPGLRINHDRVELKKASQMAELQEIVTDHWPASA